MKLLITGCPRSGTLHTAKVLQKSGVRVGHECFKADGIVTWLSIEGARTWKGLTEQKPRVVPVKDFDMVLQQVREPLACIRSLSIIMRVSKSYASAVVPLIRGQNELLYCMRFWFYWNSAVGTFAQSFYRVEDLPQALPKICGSVGVPVPRTYPNVSTSLHSKRPHFYRLPELTWEDLFKVDSGLARQIKSMAVRYGYES